MVSQAKAGSTATVARSGTSQNPQGQDGAHHTNWIALLSLHEASVNVKGSMREFSAFMSHLFQIKGAHGPHALPKGLQAPDARTAYIIFPVKTTTTTVHLRKYISCIGDTGAVCGSQFLP